MKHHLHTIHIVLAGLTFFGMAVLIMLTMQNMIKNSAEPDVEIQLEEPNQSIELYINNEEAYVPPDPCGLTTVICEGEEAPKIASVSTIRSVSAYTSRVEETDDTPCIGASGDDLCALYAQGTNICASNAFPLGTELTVEGLGTCVVLDRMNSRYQHKVDWYMGYDLEAALNWGVRSVEVATLL